MRGDRRRSGLTPREREVLGLVRVGLTNEEIAARLGISPDTAKYHVSQILAKLGVATREDAAAMAVPEGRGWWRRLGAWGLAVKLALGAATLAVLAGVAVLAWAVASNGSGDSGEVIAPDYLVYTLSGNRIAVVDPLTTAVLHAIPTGSDPEMVVSRDGSTIYLTDRDTAGDYQLSVIDTQAWRVLSQLPAPDRIANKTVGSSGMSVSSDGQYVYIHKWRILSGQYSTIDGSTPNTDDWWDIFDAATGQFLLNPPHVPNCGISVLFPPLDGSSRLAILCHQQTALVFVDSQTGQIAGTIAGYQPLSDDACSRSEPGIANVVQAPSGIIYMVTPGGCVRVIDPATMTITSTFNIQPPHGWRVLYDLVALSPDSQLFIGVGPGVSSDDLVHEVWVIDPKTQTRLETIPVEQTTCGFGLSPDGNALYTVAWISSALTAIDVDTGRQLWQLADGGAPEGIVRTAKRPLASPKP